MTRQPTPAWMPRGATMPDATPDDSIAAWLASPEVDDLVARVKSRLDKPTARLCDDCHERPAPDDLED